MERLAADAGGEALSAGMIWGTVSEFNIGGTPTAGTVILGGGLVAVLGDDKATLTPPRPLSLEKLRGL